MGLNTTTAHEPTPACADHHCAFHDVDEPIPPPDQQLPGATVCGECWHYYPSGEALLAEYERARAELYAAHPEDGMPPERTVEEIYFCQLCLHDL